MKQIEHRRCIKPTSSRLAPTAILILALSLSVASAQNDSRPLAPPVSVSPPIAQPVSIDPATGLPIAELPVWKTPEWQGPDLVLTNVDYDGWPISEIALRLRKQFAADFDILLPEGFGAGRELSPDQIDWNSTAVKLKMKNVTASELFNAMNLLFENNRTPLRWELKLNGSRRVALLRVLDEPKPIAAGAPSPLQLKRVYFVGDLTGDEKSGGMSFKDIVKTVTDVTAMAFNNPAPTIQFHEPAQLLVVAGTAGQLNFIQETLEALRMKATLHRGLQSTRDSASTATQAASSGASVGGENQNR